MCPSWSPHLKPKPESLGGASILTLPSGLHPPWWQPAWWPGGLVVQQGTRRPLPPTSSACYLGVTEAALGLGLRYWSGEGLMGLSSSFLLLI